MATLRVSLFGGVRVSHGSSAGDVPITKGVQMLLAYLLLGRHRSHPRETLAALFWGDQSDDRARGCLNTTLWRLRRVLEPDDVPRGTYLHTTPSGEVAFNADSDYWLDVAIFERHATAGLAKPVQQLSADDAAKMEDALTLYGGELLEGIYEDWALRERERLRCLHLDSLAHLLAYHRDRGAYERSIAHGRRLLEDDPLREEIHREMIRLYLVLGQRSLAVQQYETCRQVLWSELGVQPLPETQALHASMGGEPAVLRSKSDSISVSELLRRLRSALHTLDRTRAEMQDVIRLAEQSEEKQPTPLPFRARSAR